MAKSFTGSRHAHGCRECNLRYEDACTTPKDDGLCTRCRGGRPWMLLIAHASPHDCCRERARLASKDERDIYRLAGAHLWFICALCKRTHPFNPATTPAPLIDDQTD